jgi:anti-sigma B factor antagonist
MNLKFDNSNGILIVNINELKFTNMFASEFRDKLEELINEGNYRILINLEKINYMDSSALGSIVSVFNHLNEISTLNNEKSRLAICSLNKNVEFLFNMLRINGIIDIYADRDSALEMMK